MESAQKATEFKVTSNGFAITCAQVAKGTQVFFINDTDGAAEVSLTKSGNDFDAQLPSRTSTYPYTFDTAGTFVLMSKPDSTLTLFVTE